MRFVMAFLVILVLLTACAERREVVVKNESGLIDVIEEERILPVEVEEKNEEVEKPKEKIAEEPEKEKPILQRREYNNPRVSDVLQYIRMTQGIPKHQMNEEECVAYRYSLKYLRLRRIRELYGLKCKMVFLFFGYGDEEFLYTFRHSDLAEFVFPGEDYIGSEEEYEALLNEPVEYGYTGGVE